MPDPAPLLVVGRGRRTEGYNPAPDLRAAQRAFEKAEAAWLAAAKHRRDCALRAREMGGWRWAQIAELYHVDQHRAREIAYPRKRTP